MRVESKLRWRKGVTARGKSIGDSFPRQTSESMHSFAHNDELRSSFRWQRTVKWCSSRSGPQHKVVSSCNQGWTVPKQRARS